VTLLLVFLMLFFGTFALFLGGGLVGQGYLYQQPAPKMPLRALIAAVLVAGFITLWVRIDRGSPGRYDTLPNFTGFTTAEFTEFEAVRWSASQGKLKLDDAGNPTETVAKYKRAAGGAFLEDGTGAPFDKRGVTPAGGQYMVGAIRVKGPDDAEPVRYNATFKDGPGAQYKTYTPELKFVEEKGSRYVEVNQLGTLYVPSTATVAVALMLNAGLLLVWIVAWWAALRFSLGHALMFSAVLAAITMLALMPVLFKPNRVPKPATPAQQAAPSTSCAPAPGLHPFFV